MQFHFDPQVKISEILQLVGALTAFCVAIWQYAKSQRWKKAEFVALEIKAFQDDVAVKTALTMLDWAERDYELFRYSTDSDRRLVRVDYSLVGAALRIHHPGNIFTKEEAAIRDIFDRFFSYLERFESFIEAGLIQPGDLNPYLHYWIDVLSGNYPGLRKSGILPALWRFVDNYGYSGVRRLIERYKRIEFDQVHEAGGPPGNSPK